MVGNFVQNTAFVCCIYSLKMESHTVDGSACHDEGPDKWVFFLIWFALSLAQWTVYSIWQGYYTTPLYIELF